MPIRQDRDKPKVIAIVGPTASGKSALGVYLAQKLEGEVISADSRQVYKGLDIGTGKVTKKEMQGIPHHLLSVASPQKVFTASDFVKRAEKVIARIDVPIVVGGTGFYIDTLLGRMSIPEVAPNPKLRAQLEKKSVRELYHMLRRLDPRRAKTIEPEHKRRLIRAIEIAKALGKSPSQKSIKKYDVLWLGLSPAALTLKKNIHARLLKREKGMIVEATQLHKHGLSFKRMEELGLEYRSLAQFLQKKITRDEMLVELERAINKYAKRQSRWFRRNSDIKWIKNNTAALRLAKKILGGR